MVNFSEVTECSTHKDLFVLGSSRLADMICFLSNHTVKFRDVFIRVCSAHNNNNGETEVNSSRGQIILIENGAML